jgi:hypothetical protein
LVIGNARSGSTILGSVIDAHPNAVISNETAGSSPDLWRSLDRNSLLEKIFQTAESLASIGRPSEGYLYQIGPPPSVKQELLVMGDKTWNPMLLLLHGNHRLLLQLETRLQLPIRLIESIRNPFDTIARMHTRSGLPLRDRTRWFFMHCEAAAAIRERLPTDRVLASYHENLIADPTAELHRIGSFLGLPPSAEQERAVRRSLFSSPRRCSEQVFWSKEEIDDVMMRMEQFHIFHRYMEQPPVNMQSL